MVAACPFPWPRGTPIRILRMAEALALRGHDVHVVTYHLGRHLDNLPFTIHRIADVPGYTYTEPGPTLRKLFQLDPSVTQLLRRLHGEKPFDILHGHHYEGLLVALAASSGARVVYDAHTTLAGELPHYRMILPRWFWGWIGGFLDRRLPGRATHTISCSESIRDFLVGARAVAAARVTVVPNGVEPERFHTGPRRSPPAENLIFTGNLSSYQGVDLMLEAFAELRRTRPGAKLWIASDSSFEPFEKKARKLGVREAIDLRPESFDEQMQMLIEADVALNPRTDCDGIPQKLLNYMAAGKPIVSFDGSARYLEHERTGLCVPNGQTRAMADAIGRLLDDRKLAARLGQAAQRQVRDEHSWSGVARQVEKIYARILEPQSAWASKVPADT